MTDLNTIIASLANEAADAAEAGRDSIEWNVTASGEFTKADIANGWYAEAFFDDSDPNNIGWAYRLTPVVDGERQMTRQESGSLMTNA